MMELETALHGVARLAFDTSPIIYFIEAHPRYDSLVTEVFRHLDRRLMVGFTSVIALAEVLVFPSRTGNEELRARDYYFLLNSDELTTLSIGPEIASCAVTTQVQPFDRIHRMRANSASSRRTLRVRGDQSRALPQFGMGLTPTTVRMNRLGEGRAKADVDSYSPSATVAASMLPGLHASRRLRTHVVSAPLSSCQSCKSCLST